MDYRVYNREERDICAHLFRLLLDDQPNWGPLKEFLDATQLSDPRIYCEVALIRDAYCARKPNVAQFMDNLCELIARQNQVQSYTSFGNLPNSIIDPDQTNPRQISFKLKKMGGLESVGDRVVYSRLQSMFNAKPDLVICTGSTLVVYEVKYTSPFKARQMHMTERIAEVWATLLYTDLGFESVPAVSVKTLGMASVSPDMSWERVYRIAAKHWVETDFSVAVLSKVLAVNR